jgi:dihydroxyacetone kinase DhaKLM complex PTS-EIIA-like component DhaM
VTTMRAVQVVLDGKLVAEPPQAGGIPRQVLDALADAVMEALIDADAEDPFVFIDASTSTLQVEIVVRAETQTEAFARGIQLIDSVLGGLAIDDARPQVLDVSGRAKDLIPT